MTSRTSLNVLLQRAVEGDRSGVLRRGSGVQRSDVVRQIGERLFRQEWLVTHDRALGLRAPLDCARLRAAIPTVRAITPLFREAVAACAEVVTRAGRILEYLGRPTTPADLSSRVASVVGTHVVAQGARPTGAALDDLAMQVVERVVESDARWQWATGGRVVTPAEAVTDYAGLDDACWERMGQETLRTHPPERVLLGPNRRTPLVASGPRPNWYAGSGRSVYERYRLRWTSAGDVDCPHRPPPTLDTPADPFGVEVGRAAHPYGLVGEGHHRVIMALYQGGARTEDAGGTRTGRDTFRALDAECRPLPSRDVLASGVAGLLDFWWWISVGGRIQRPLPDSDLVPLEQIQRAIVRKGWMAVLAWDRVSEEPVRTCQFVRAARIAVECGIAPALQAVREGLFDPDDRVGGTGDVAIIGDAPSCAPEIADLLARRTRTLALLATLDREQAMAIAARAPEWAQGYGAAVANSGRPAAAFLDDVELAEYLQEAGF